MTLPMLRRQPVRPRPVLVSVSDRWRRDDAGDFRREVVVRTPAGELRPVLLPDTHPALVRFLARVAA